MVDQLHLEQLLFQQILQVIPLLKHKEWLELIEQELFQLLVILLLVNEFEVRR